MPKFERVSKGNAGALLRQAIEAQQFLVPGKPRELKGNFSSENTIFFEPEFDESLLAYEPEDQVITVSTGITNGALRQILNSHKQFFPLAGSDDALVFELVSSGSDIFGDERFGGLRSLALGAQVLLSTGEVINCGGKVVKNVSGYDLTKLFIGSRCTLGIPLTVNLRLCTQSQSKAMVCLQGDDLAMIAKIINKTLLAALPLTKLQVVDDRLIQKDQSCQFSLTAQFEGSKQVLSELSDELVALWRATLEQVSRANSFAISVVSGDAKDHDQVNNGVNPYPVAHFANIELVAARDVLFKLWEFCLSLDLELYGHMQASACRLKLYTGKRDTIQTLVQNLETWAESEKQTFLAAYADDTYEYRVRKFPTDDEGSVRLKRELKQKFDPRNMLNPLVLL